MIIVENQLLSVQITDAIINFKDGTKRIVLLLDEALQFSSKQIQFVSNANRTTFLQTNNPFLIENLEKEKIAGIEIDLK